MGGVRLGRIEWRYGLRALADTREQVGFRKLGAPLAAHKLVILGAKRKLLDLVLHGREP